MSRQAMSSIEACRVSAKQPMHPRTEVGPRCLHHQVKMITHQTVSVNLPVRLLTSLSQTLQESFSVLIIPENLLAPITAINQMIDRSLIFHPHLARHPRRLSPPKNMSIFIPDPFGMESKRCQEEDGAGGSEDEAREHT